MCAQIRPIGEANGAIRRAEKAQQKRSADPPGVFGLREGTLLYSQSVRHKTRTARRCRCGHDHGAHVHYRPGSECALCDTCAQFRPATGSRPVLGWLTGSPDDPDPDPGEADSDGVEPDGVEPDGLGRGTQGSRERKPGGRGSRWRRLGRRQA
jgi:hypothetical protein